MQLCIYEKPSFLMDADDSRLDCALNALATVGVMVSRIGLFKNDQPDNPEAAAIFAERGRSALPIITADGRVIKTGAYPDNKELSLWAEMAGTGCACKKKQRTGCGGCGGCHSKEPK